MYLTLSADKGYSQLRLPRENSSRAVRRVQNIGSIGIELGLPHLKIAYQSENFISGNRTTGKIGPEMIHTKPVGLLSARKG